MSVIRPAMVGILTAAYVQIIPPPVDLPYVDIPEGGLMWWNRDSVSRTFTIEERSGDVVTPIWDTPISAGRGFFWQGPLRLMADGAGIWAKVDAFTTTEPTWRCIINPPAGFPPFTEFGV